MEDIKVSWFKNAYTTTPIGEITLLEVFNRIRTGACQKSIEEIRQLSEKSERDELKKNLPCVTFAGIFDPTRKNLNLKQASSLACLDWDHVKDPGAFRDWVFKNHDFILASWISPSGNGVKALALIPVVTSDKEYKQYYEGLLQEFDGAKNDKGTNDISRLCYESWDPDIKIKEIEKVCNFEKKIIITQKNSTTSSGKVNNVTFNQIMADLALKGEIYIPDNRHNYIFKLTCAANRVGIAKEAFLEFTTIKFKGLDKEEIKTIEDAYTRYQDEHGKEADTKKGTKKIIKSKIISAVERNQLAASEPDPKPLYYNLWNEGEIAILAGETGCGKSICAVFILNELCKIGYKILYYDFELSPKQFQDRYKGYQFHENFLFGDWEPDPDEPEAVFNIDTILADIEASGVDIVCIDNITALSLKNTVDQDAAMEVMRGLKKLQKEGGISVLVLAHTPKRRQSDPLIINDLAGSKTLANFADSVFFINFSNLGKNIRYIKHVKTRTPKLCNTFGVVIEKGQDGMIKLVHDGELSEQEHLTGEPIDERISTAANLRDKEGKSQTQIAQLMKISQATVNRLLKKFDEGRSKAINEEVPL